MRFPAVICAVICALSVLPSLAIGATATAAEAPAAPSSVTIPLSQFEELRKSNESASATVVDLMTVSGTFAAKNVSFAFAGRSVGTRTATTVLSDAAELTLANCKGDALLLRGGKGVYQVIPLAPAFTLRCDARPSGSDRLRMNVSPAILAVRSEVTDGELVAGDEDGDGARGYTLVRQVVGSNEKLATSATGRYLITLLPDTSRFRYAIQVHNPNRSTAPLPLHLVSGEHLQQIDSAAPYEPNGASYEFAMPPGDSTITLSGELQGTSFAPPVEASLQYVVVESHPLLRPATGGSPKRVSTGETGIDTQYRGALAFEIGPRERISWSVTRLEAMRAISYAIHNTTHTLFIPANGPILGETSLEMDNQGAPELILPRQPEPTFVSLQGEPILMTKNARGQLTVPLSAGRQRLVVQHRQAIARFPIVLARLDVPRLPVPSTYTHVQLRYPTHWLPLWESFGTQTHTWVPDGGALLALLLLALWLERVLAFLAMAPKRRIAAAILLAFAALNVPVVLWAVVLACAFVTLVWAASQRAKLSLARVGAVIAATLLVVIIAFVHTLSKNVGSSDSDSYSGSNISSAGNLDRVTGTDNAVTDTAVVVTGTTGGGAGKVAVPQESRNDVAYQGLPAKFELPDGARSGNFREQMLSPERPQRVTLVLLSMSFVTWTAVALAIVAAWLIWRERAAIKAALRIRLVAALPAQTSS
ncbi:MAG: hypothetical protein JWO56_224 [Acidobacteria bacterium]|nr:hypothetical protein [Acidobacteriota bacterium]